MPKALMAVLLAAGVSAQDTPEASELARAVKLRDSGKKIEALEAFRAAARVNPALPFVYREIGLILLDRRDFKGASEAFRAAVRRDPEDFDSRYNLALSLGNSGHAEQGMKELRFLTERRPQWAQPWFGLGHIYATQGRKE